MPQACCSPSSNCAQGFPVQCSAACADAWLPYRRDCRAYLSANQPGLSNLGTACHDTRKVDDAPTAPQGCPNGYEQHGDNCYLLSLDRATYNIAVSSATSIRSLSVNLLVLQLYLCGVAGDCRRKPVKRWVASSRASTTMYDS